MSKELNELIKELGKIVDGNQSIVEEMDKLKLLYETLKLELAEEFDYPFEEKEKYWKVGEWGEIADYNWFDNGNHTERYNQGNVFKTKPEAELERDRRALLTRFRQFRDKCNGDWKPDLNHTKYYIYLDCDYLMLSIFSSMIRDAFNLFGYFKNKEDCQRAIELFGDEIKRLWVDE